jgi:hypothetical protein
MVCTSLDFINVCVGCRFGVWLGFCVYDLWVAKDNEFVTLVGEVFNGWEGFFLARSCVFFCLSR